MWDSKLETGEWSRGEQETPSPNRLGYFWLRPVSLGAASSNYNWFSMTERDIIWLDVIELRGYCSLKMHSGKWGRLCACTARQPTEFKTSCNTGVSMQLSFGDRYTCPLLLSILHSPCHPLTSLLPFSPPLSIKYINSNSFKVALERSKYQAHQMTVRK